ncbi:MULTISPECIES: glycosyltransferase family 2 protein [Oscillospiraceae]|uniref:glycosyltransferase family 2 protein n=1 Tax=Oscillospiraceae TaxID=216572 RepID=UPI000B3A994C|nr:MULTISPECIES: glycosyltransferase family 2 protein [Oscillospiraceae]MBM6721590.1 glycosyltransferase family 2 protein [Pseudoflavonifractor phocaeensis]OUO37095.1 N-acetylglucosaminyltransferase [Flavonifractor sp. An306]
MSILEFVKGLNWSIVLLFTLLYLYQGFYLVVGLLLRRHKDRHEPSRLHRFAVVVSARNEEQVIGELLDSLRKQNYPQELLDLYVVADNCTDDTAGAARKAGAFVYERRDPIHKGKGYAMDYLFRQLKEEGKDCYDGYFVFDADNLVDPNFVREMNRTFDKGYDAVTCYRNSKNFGDNWISAGYSIWFLREARFLNFPRTLLGTNCHVSGTGFLVSAKVIEENGGWPFHLLTEDIQFSVDCAIRGKRIGYCDSAVIYDEQPVTFRQSWDQRLRWSKGFYQVDREYTVPLLKGMLRPGRLGTSCYDMFVTVAPGMLLTLAMILFNAVVLAACLTQPAYLAARVIHETVGFIGSSLGNFYLGLLLYGLCTVLSEWKHIQAPALKKLGYVFTFPIFMFTYIPISIAALVRKVEWKPIYHTATKRVGGMG